jgi:hypothetical protein
MATNSILTDEPNIGFVGLGVMGEPMCLNLAKKARSKVIGFDLSPHPLERLAEEGVGRAVSLADLAGRCGLIFLSLPDSDAVKAVCCSADGLVAHMKASSTLVDMSTSPVDLTRALAAQCQARRIGFADAPVARTREAAIRGDLSVMVGCDAALFDQLLPVLKLMGSDVTRCGDIGSGQLMKILNNMVLFQNVCALTEAIAVARRNAVDLDIFLSVISKGSGDSFAVRNHGMKSMLPRIFPNRAFSTRYAKKDLGYALDLANSVGLDLKCAKVVMERLTESEMAGFGDQYFPVFLNIIDPIVD